MRLGRARSPWPTVGRLVALGLVSATTAALLSAPVASWAGHMYDWTHDHSSTVIKPRPSGYSGIVQRFGQPCNSAYDDARSLWPHKSGRYMAGYVYYHTYIGRNVGYNIRKHIDAAHRNDATDYGVWGRDCRYIAGTTKWSTHAWGAAIDTNSARNPLGQTYWDGRGADGKDYGTYVPSVWTGHNFYWGLNFSGRKDPMHFQYATNY